MIHDTDRRWYIGGSDIDKYVLTTNRNTKSWSEWWAEKCGLADRNHFANSAMMTGTMLEHSILKAVVPDVTWDGQIIYLPLMLRINYDGWHDGIIYEVKCHRATTAFDWDRYRGQLTTQAWVYEKMADELGLPPFKEIHVLEYAFTPDEECTIYETAVAEAGDIPVDKGRIKDIVIPYKTKQFKGIRSNLKPLARQLKRLLPQEEEMAKKLWSIFTDNMDKCIVTSAETGIERHHIFEGMQGFKGKSEEFGFVVPLHISVHPNGAYRTDPNWQELDHWLKRKCQEYFIEVAHLGSRQDWYDIFGKYYDDRTDEKVWLNGKFEWDLTEKAHEINSGKSID